MKLLVISKQDFNIYFGQGEKGGVRQSETRLGDSISHYPLTVTSSRTSTSGIVTVLGLDMV